jgi:O-succinylbenzoate-CoA ligase
VGNALHQPGVRKGDRVALLETNSTEFVETYFALAKIGAILVPLNWRLVANELKFILEDSGASVLMFSQKFIHTVSELHKGKNIKLWIHTGPDRLKPKFALQYHELTADASCTNPPLAAKGDDALCIVYSSGTTGFPKGVLHTHNTVMWVLIDTLASIRIHEYDRWLSALPLFHVSAIHPLTVSIYAGISYVLMAAFDAGRTWELIGKEKITTLWAVPTMLNAMLQTLKPEQHDYSSIRRCMTGAAPVPITLIEAYGNLDIDIHQIYGLTEACGPTCISSAEDAITRPESTGKPFFHTSMRIVDENMNDVGPNKTGEVIISSKHVMKEYWNNPIATGEAIVDGWLKTGDVAEMDDEGHIYIRERIKDMIISGGENIYPAELENMLRSHEGIKDAAVIGQTSEKWGESPCAVIVRKDKSLTTGEILAWCEKKLAHYKLPKHVEFINEIPRNPSGKVLKKLLRERFPGPAPE